MNKKIFVLLIVFASLLTFGLVAAPDTTVHAQAGGCVDATGAACTPTPQPQGCVDATGAPCTPTPEPGGGGGGNQNPPASVVTATFTAIPTLTTVPTSTPFPIALPESDFLGSCTSENFSECKEQFKCENGLLVIKVDLYSGNGTKYDFYCIPHEEAPLLDLPFTLPQDNGATDDNWTSGCFGDDVDACVEDLASLCESEGGDLSVWYDDEGGAGVYCENESEAGQVVSTTTPLSIAAPDNENSTEASWDEECGFWTCWISSLSCMADGGTGYELDTVSGHHIYHCDVPSKSNTTPPSTWLPWVVVGIVGILVVMLLPAVQKVREAAHRRTQTKEHILLARQPTNATKPKSETKVTGDFDSDGDVDGRDYNL